MEKDNEMILQLLEDIKAQAELANRIYCINGKTDSYKKTMILARMCRIEQIVKDFENEFFA